MARNFDGASDHCAPASNAVPGLNVATKTFSFWQTRTADSSAGNAVMGTGPDFNVSTGIMRVVHFTAVTAGMRIQIASDWSGTDGLWRTTNDVSITPHHVVVSYDRGSTANDAVVWVDGVSVAVTRVTAPTSTAVVSDDSWGMGEITGASDYLGALQHVAVDPSIWDSTKVNRARWWGRPGSVYMYYPLLTDKIGDEGTAAANLTDIVGTTISSMITPVVRPGSAMMGMGIGW